MERPLAGSGWLVLRAKLATERMDDGRLANAVREAEDHLAKATAAFGDDAGGDAARQEVLEVLAQVKAILVAELARRAAREIDG